jgi:hypothetical protein
MENEPTGITDHAIANASLVLSVIVIGKLIKKGIFTRQEIRELLEEQVAKPKTTSSDSILDDSVSDDMRDIFQMLLKTFSDTYEPGDKSENPNESTP